MLVHIASSLKTVLSGYLLGVVIGIPLGICMAWFKPVDRFLRPLFDLIKPIPGIAWIPVMITLFGIGLLGKAMIVFMTAFIACMVKRLFRHQTDTGRTPVGGPDVWRL